VWQPVVGTLALHERLQAFETRYQMSLEDCYQRFRAGEMGDLPDRGYFRTRLSLSNRD